MDDGVARHRALIEGGLSRHRLATLQRTGRWQRALPGVVIAHSGPLSQRQRWQAALAYGGPGSVRSHHSAGVLHGLRVAERGVHVTVPHGRHLAGAGSSPCTSRDIPATSGSAGWTALRRRAPSSTSRRG